MSKLPTILRVVGWGAFSLLMVIVFIVSFGTFFMDKIDENILALAATVSVVPILCLVALTFGGLFGASVVSWRLKRLAATQGRKVVARIVKVSYMGAEGSKHNTVPVYRFDLEVDYEGEVIRASTEVKARYLDQSKFPPGTSVSAVYDHSSGAIAMLDRNDRVVEFF